MAVALVIAIGVVAGLRRLSKSKVTKRTSLLEDMQQSASAAVVLAKNEHAIELDYRLRV